MDWEALQPFLKTHTPPQLNITIDAHTRWCRQRCRCRSAMYTGHSEHEFITEKQLQLQLQMDTPVLIELAK